MSEMYTMNISTAVKRTLEECSDKYNISIIQIIEDAVLLLYNRSLNEEILIPKLNTRRRKSGFGLKLDPRMMKLRSKLAESHKVSKISVVEFALTEYFTYRDSISESDYLKVSLKLAKERDAVYWQNQTVDKEKRKRNALANHYSLDLPAWIDEKLKRKAEQGGPGVPDLILQIVIDHFIERENELKQEIV